MTSKQRSRSFNLVPIDSYYTTLYRLSIVTLALGRTFTSQYIASQTDRQLNSTQPNFSDNIAAQRLD